jgi:hypothetical protein
MLLLPSLPQGSVYLTKKTRGRMITSAETMYHGLLSFRNFIEGLQPSVPPEHSIDNSNRLQSSAGPPPRNDCIDSLLSSTEPPPDGTKTPCQQFPIFALLQKFGQQTTTAYRAILSHVEDCTDSKTKGHNVLLQLPRWEDISNGESQDVKDNVPTHLFFTICPSKSNNWQFARMSFLL